MRRERGASLAGCLLGLGLGLLVLQALLDVVASAHHALQAQRLALRRQESEALAQQLLRAVAEASRRGGGPQADGASGAPALTVRPGPGGELLEANFVADAAPGACGEAAQPEGSAHRYRLDIDGAGTLRCRLDAHAPQPLADGLGAWELEFVELRGASCAAEAAGCTPRLRRVRAPQVQDWNQVLLMRARLRGPAPGSRPGAPQSWVALPLVQRPRS